MPAALITFLTRFLVVVLLGSMAMPCEDCDLLEPTSANAPLVQVDGTSTDDHSDLGHDSCCDGCLTCSARSAEPLTPYALAPTLSEFGEVFIQDDGASGQPLSIWHPPRA